MSRQIPVGDAPLSSRFSGKQPVWDLPIRLVHWLLAALIAFSWWSVEYHHTGWHIWSGCAILTLLLFRVMWGVVGSSTARFSGFVRGPAAIRDYLRGRWTGIGHNPLGALSVVALLGDTALQVGLGLIAQDDDGIYAGPLSGLVSSDTSDWARGVHSVNFYVLLGLIALHIGAIIVYRLRGRRLVGPMITGKAILDPTAEPLRPGKWWAALLCLAVGVALTRWVIAGVPPFGP
ncbi:cytochrome b/b6 domain-containing protein [Sphingomonas sp.]|uniref:cytochrome b/b6 domain-containing protein n=1 Tax=Sphingomonas sp. TaxID=28214 RepID=UPI0025E98555|nr:cytochrome b/b6 domain-containing protein [Sphingomonas sp.]MBV9528863.1 cytochrome b/b6 domain-containing protein [Sphingomonas sp.]